MLKLKNKNKKNISEKTTNLYDEEVFSWEAPEYIQHIKSKSRYMIEGAVVVLLVVYAVFSGNYTMAVALLVLIAVYHYLHVKHPPKKIKIVISKIGVKIGRMTFPYNHIQAFWIMYHPPYLKTLNLRIRKDFFSEIVIQLADIDPIPIRRFLREQMTELEGKTEKLSEAFIRLLKL